MADQEARVFELPDVGGHRFALLPEGPERLEALIALIDGAKTSLKLLFYIFADDACGRRVRDALIAAARRGVDVALLVDGFGSKISEEEFFAPLERVARYFCRYEPRRGRRYLLRNHQKLAVADEAIAIVGGFNIEDAYFAPRGSKTGWRDLGIRLEGPAAARLARYFEALGQWASNRKAQLPRLRLLIGRYTEQDGDVRWLLGGPTSDLSPWASALRLDLCAANSADMIAAYFAPHWALLRLLRECAKRGHACVVTARRSDNNATIAAARNRYQYLIPSGVKVYEYRPMMLHTKLYVVDDNVYIGSANFDVRSLYLNLELMLRVRDAGFAAAVRRYIAAEVEESEAITPEAYKAMSGPWERIKGRLSYILISVLDYNVSRRLNFPLELD